MKKIKNINNKQKKWPNVLAIIALFIIVFIDSGLILLYGPWSYVRDTLVTTAMTTYNHQWIAKMFYSDDTISEVMKNNRVIEGQEYTDASKIKIEDTKNVKYASFEEEQILKRDKGNNIYKIIPIKGATYSGYIVAVYDSTKVDLVHCKGLGTSGQRITTIAKNNNAIVAMNASGFSGIEGSNVNRKPAGIIIENGKVLWDESHGLEKTGIIGFNEKGILILTRSTTREVLNMGIKDAVSFGPFLIINGNPAVVKGNGGWGIAPRTAIAQRRDGIVLFAVIDGRQSSSVGASIVDMIKLFQKYGAYNAANLDGGASSALVVKNKIINNPTGGGQTGERWIPNAFIVK